MIVRVTREVFGRKILRSRRRGREAVVGLWGVGARKVGGSRVLLWSVTRSRGMV
jgi:hypothetical protein